VEDQYYDLKKKQLELKSKCLEHWGLPVIEPNNYGERRYDNNNKFKTFNKYQNYEKPIQPPHKKRIIERKEETIVSKSKEELAEDLRNKHTNTIEWTDNNNNVSYNKLNHDIKNIKNKIDLEKIYKNDE
jgi:hypothetical protein